MTDNVSNQNAGQTQALTTLAAVADAQARHNDGAVITAQPPPRHGEDQTPAGVPGDKQLHRPTRCGSSELSAAKLGRHRGSFRCSCKKAAAVGGLFGLGAGLISSTVFVGTAKGAAIGALVGSVIPGVGTAAGAVIGMALGGLVTGATTGLVIKGIAGAIGPASEERSVREVAPVSRRTMDGVRSLSASSRHGPVYKKRRVDYVALFSGALVTSLGVACIVTGVAVPVGAVLTAVGGGLLLKGLGSVISATSSTSLFSRRRIRQEVARLPKNPETLRSSKNEKNSRDEKAQKAKYLASQLTGINNSRVDCFQNATLQALRELAPEFRLLFKREIKGNPQLRAGGIMHKEDLEGKQRFRRHAARYLRSFFQGKVANYFDSLKLRKQVLKGINNQQFPQVVAGVSRQQCDAEEYMKQILDAADWPHLKMVSTRKLHNIRAGKHQLRRSDEYAQTLQLEIGGAGTVQKAFEDFTSWELLEEDNWLRWDDDADDEPVGDPVPTRPKRARENDNPEQDVRSISSADDDATGDQNQLLSLSPSSHRGDLPGRGPGAARSKSLGSLADLTNDSWKQVERSPERNAATRRKSLGERVEKRAPDADRKVHTEKQLKLVDPPETLIISLKRFAYDEKEQRWSKDNKEVKIGRLSIEGENGAPSRVYEPHAIVCHDGAHANCGHYYTYRKIDGTWWKYNDDLVSKATQAELDAAEKSGYIVIYRHVSGAQAAV